VKADTLEELLAEAGRGLLAMHVANPEAVRGVQSKTIELTAEDPAYLLFDWLSELLYAFESGKLLLAEFKIELASREGEALAEPNSLPGSVWSVSAICRGEPMDPARHTMDHEVKAITYHGLVCQRRCGAWLAEVIVDI
jgi:SHS2 domain-containing protein